jgi:hypothetical protein
MDVSPPTSFGPDAPSSAAATIDPRLQPTPDYGTLGPGSDISGLEVDSNRSSAPNASAQSVGRLIAIGLGIAGALLAGAVRNGGSLFSRLVADNPIQPASKDLSQLDRMRPQKQAETLLELAVRHSAGAVEQISTRVDRWHGRVQWNSQIASLTTAALNSDDMRVRESGVEVELAAYGLSKNSESLEYLLKTAESPNHAEKIWALWALGLMANRGVETEQVVNVLTAHTKDPDVDSRHWAVEALALTGNDQALETLLTAMHDDASPLVRERAACGLASSGLFTPQQRLTAVPRLLNYTDDAALDAQTHAWAFHALADITHQRLPNDSAQWRSWYDSQKTD